MHPNTGAVKNHIGCLTFHSLLLDTGVIVKSCRGLVVASIFCALISTSITASAGERSLRFAQAEPSQPAPAQPATSQPATPEPSRQQPAQAGQPQPPDAQQPNQNAAASSQADAAEEPVGNVATLRGTATVTHNGASAPLKLKGDIFKGDTLQTGKNSTLIVTFTDDTTLNLSASARVVIDNFVYAEGGKANAALINVARGTMAFVAASVAKTGDMKIETPTASLGIRGTTGVVDVPEGASATANNVGVKLYPDADGKVGRIEVKARDGAPLGMLTQGASGFTVRGEMVPGFGMRMSAMPMVMSAQQMARDRGFVQRVHVMQGIGRNIVREQRNFRMQNPQRQPGLQRRNGLQDQPGLHNQPGRQPGLRNPQQAPQRPGFQNRQPGQERRSGFQNAPTQQRPGLQNQPGLQRQPGAPGRFGQRQFGLPGLPIPQGPTAAPRSAPQGQSAQQRRQPKQHQDRKKTDKRN